LDHGFSGPEAANGGTKIGGAKEGMSEKKCTKNVQRKKLGDSTRNPGKHIKEKDASRDAREKATKPLRP